MRSSRCIPCRPSSPFGTGPHCREKRGVERVGRRADLGQPSQLTPSSTKTRSPIPSVLRGRVE
eukprot:4265890-Prorocentrum_lima.AAC.1